MICLVVVASFAIFAYDQAKGASTHQQEVLAKGASSNTSAESTASYPTSAANESSVRKVIDEASNELASPLSGITSGSSSPWVIHGVDLLVILVIYCFGLAFLARVLQSRR